MNAIGNLLSWLFTYIIYPVLVIGLFLFILVLIYSITTESRDHGLIRRLTAAFLPVVILVFVVSDRESSNSVSQFIGSINPLLLFVFGCSIGLAIIELGIFLGNKDSEVGIAIYLLFLSIVDTFIMYSTMQGILGRLQFFLVGMILTAGLDVIFRGPPKFIQEAFQHK